MDLFSLLDRVKQAIYDNPDTPHQPANDPGGLISDIEKLFGQARQSNGDRSVLPASQECRLQGETFAAAICRDFVDWGHLAVCTQA